MLSSNMGAMSLVYRTYWMVSGPILVHRAFWLVFCLALVLLPACHSQNEQTLRSVQPPYPLSFSISGISGSSQTYGPTNSTARGKYYRTLTLHNDSKLFVGGKEELFAADPANLTTVGEVTDLQCEDCDNYIRIIQLLSDGASILECGTGTSKPYCRQRSSQNLSEVESAVDFSDIMYLVPELYNENSSWLLVDTTGSDYQIFAGTMQPAVARANLQINFPSLAVKFNDLLKTKNSRGTVLNGPQFVGDPIEYNGRIYFFFREIATEVGSGYSGTTLYSRVAIVCKNETGGKAFMEYTETDIVTFVKARLECSIVGNFDYHYNEIRDIYHFDEINVVLASFATSAAEVASSAVCAYRLDEIETLFQNGDFLGQPSDGRLWVPLPSDPVTPRQASCPNGSTYTDMEYIAIQTSGQLMADTAANKLHYENPSGTIRSNPLLVSYGERFSQIVVDENVLNSIDVMFIGTENGTVLKAYLNEERSEARIVEEISLNADGKTPVLTMLKSAADQAVFVGTDIGVYKIPFQHCQDFTTLQTCLDAKDPYCRWTGGDFCSNSATGQQDLQNGAGNITSDSSSGDITINVPPMDQTRAQSISNQSVNLFLFAEAPEGMNLRVDGEINCSSPCANLLFTEYRTTDSGKEFLVLFIDGSSTEDLDLNCTCLVILTIDSGATASANFTLNADTTAAISRTVVQLAELEAFDDQIRLYKSILQQWKMQVGDALSLTDVKICTESGCQ